MTLPPPTYDLVLLLDMQAEESTRAKILADARSSIEARGEIVRDDDWGERPLSYPIDRLKSAEYHLFQFHVSDNELLEGLDRDPADHRRRDALPDHQAAPGRPRPARHARHRHRRRRSPPRGRAPAPAAGEGAPPAAAGEPASPAPAGRDPAAEAPAPAAPEAPGSRRPGRRTADAPASAETPAAAEARCRRGPGRAAAPEAAGESEAGEPQTDAGDAAADGGDLLAALPSAGWSLRAVALGVV